MSEININNLVADIVQESCELKNKYTDEVNALVNYACIFSQSDDEFCELKKYAEQIGRVVEKTPSGPLYQINPINTVSGPLKLLKIRQPDITKPERGDADFTVGDYHIFKDKYLSQNNFKLIARPDFEMIELMVSDFSVRTYFSHLPLDEQFGLK
ncbi:MAG: hypothetical protein KAI67_03080 [Candidatus Pacebacteria bacterium]|nr:hypothetical protein [Candidatus Paceibacterota bacterium]